MTGGKGPLPVTDEELLARFILFKGWIRKSNLTVKPDAFIPHPYPDLSVTLHKNISEQELWRIGGDVADARGATLYGRADIHAAEVRRQALNVEPRPVSDNPNHANITGWPAEKPGQKITALQLAAKACFVSNPLSTRQKTDQG